MLYLDTSCLLKLFFPEPETDRVTELVAQEERVVVSDLAHLEAMVQIQARVEGGTLPGVKARRLRQRLDAVLAIAPYDRVQCPPSLFDLAHAQVRKPGARHCRTMDRLHLATMEGLGARRLLTNDDAQAAVARALGLVVTLPRPQ